MPHRLTLDRAARFPLPGTAVPVRLTFAPDGKLVFLASEEDRNALSLFGLDATTGECTLLLGEPEAKAYTQEEELKRERQRLMWEGVTDVQVAGDAAEPVLLVPTARGLEVSRAYGPFRPLPGTEGVREGRLFPKGDRVAFVRDGEVFVQDARVKGKPVQITCGACPGVTHGLAEYVAEEEMDAHEGFWLSPRGEWVAFKEVDDRHIPVYPIVHLEGDEVEVEAERYPLVGQANAKVRLGVIPAIGGDVVWLEIDPIWEYIARIAWAPNEQLVVQLLTRDQRRTAWVRFVPGEWEGKTLWEERSNVWINLTDHTRFLESGEILTTDETTGFRHMVLRDQDGGVVRRLTGGDWMVTAVSDVDEERRLVRFVATRHTVLERHLYEVSLDGGEVRRLTVEDGWHTVTFSMDHRTYTDQFSSLDRPPVTLLRRENGEVLWSHGNETTTTESLDFVPPEIVDLEAEDGTPLHGALYRPRGEAKHAGILSVYGGPHVQLVGNRWDLTVDMRAQLLAQEGFAVLKVDGRGSSGRGLAFESPIRRRFGTVELRDQIRAAEWLVREAGCDPRRIGIYGWSYGGFLTLTAMTKAPDVFSVGVAGAPVTDPRFYDTCYTERYMETPATNPEGYAEASVLGRADALRGKLLIIHGLLDENVHFRHTARFLRDLVEAGKEAELLVLPASRHSPRGFETVRTILDRTVSFFRDHL